MSPPMAKKTARARVPSKSKGIFSDEERAAMRETIRERARERTGAADGERDVREKIAQMPPNDREMAEKIHALIRSNAPSLVPRTWYGMPAYSKEDHVLCYFKASHKFKTRYSTLGFSEEARLDDGNMWPTEFALVRMTSLEEERIVALLRQALA